LDDDPNWLKKFGAGIDRTSPSYCLISAPLTCFGVNDKIELENSVTESHAWEAPVAVIKHEIPRNQKVGEMSKHQAKSRKFDSGGGQG